MMKIIKSRLKQIIKEELDAASKITVPVKTASNTDNKQELETGVVEEIDADALDNERGAESAIDIGDSKDDVDMMLRYLPKINRPDEYAKLLIAVLSWGISGKVPQITKSLKSISFKLSATNDKNI